MKENKSVVEKPVSNQAKKMIWVAGKGINVPIRKNCISVCT